jgi:hypothetical protein
MTSTTNQHLINDQAHHFAPENCKEVAMQSSPSVFQLWDIAPITFMSLLQQSCRWVVKKGKLKYIGSF